MASVLLPPTEEIQQPLIDAIPAHIKAIAKAAGDGTEIAANVTPKLVKAQAAITALQAILYPLGAIQPPSVIGVNNCVAATALLTLINTSIPLATTQSVILAGAPNPLTFLPAGALVTKQIEKALKYVTDFMIDPQK